MEVIFIGLVTLIGVIILISGTVILISAAVKSIIQLDKEVEEKEERRRKSQELIEWHRNHQDRLVKQAVVDAEKEQRAREQARKNLDIIMDCAARIVITKHRLQQQKDNHDKL